MSISPRVWCWPGTGPALWVLPSNSSPKFRPTRRKCTSQTEKSTSQFGLKGLFLGTGGTQRCPPRDFFVSHHRGAPPMPNPSPPCKTGRAGVWPIGACSGRNWGLRMRPQSPPGALNTEMWLGAKLFFSSRFTRGARYGKWACPSCIRLHGIMHSNFCHGGIATACFDRLDFAQTCRLFPLLMAVGGLAGRISKTLTNPRFFPLYATIRWPHRGSRHLIS